MYIHTYTHTYTSMEEDIINVFFEDIKCPNDLVWMSLKEFQLQTFCNKEKASSSLIQHS